MFAEVFLQNFHFTLIIIASTFWSAPCQSQELQSWMSAKNSCTLMKDISKLNQEEFSKRGFVRGERGWTGIREIFTDWVAVKQCVRYILSDDDSTVVPIDGKSSLTECFYACKQRYPRKNSRFGLSRDKDSDTCVCDKPSRNIFGSYSDNAICRPMECSSGNPQDLCGHATGLTVYSSYDYADFSHFSGTGQCGAFMRTGVYQFVGRALDCNETHGHIHNSNVTLSPIRSWKETVMEVGVGPSSPWLYDRSRPDPSWSGFSLENWPLNVSLWVAWTRRSLETENGDCPNTCLCTAVYVDYIGSIRTEKLNCTTNLRPVCEHNTVVPDANSDKTTETSEDRTISDNPEDVGEITLSLTTGYRTMVPNVTQRNATIAPSRTKSNMNGKTSIPGGTKVARKRTTLGLTMAPVQALTDTNSKSLFLPIALAAVGGVLLLFIIAIVIMICKRRGRGHLQDRSKQDGRPSHHGTSDQITYQGHPSESTPYIIYSSPATDHNYEALTNTEVDHSYLTIVDDETGQPVHESGRPAYETSQVPSTDHVYTALR